MANPYIYIAFLLGLLVGGAIVHYYWQIFFAAYRNQKSRNLDTILQGLTGVGMGHKRKGLTQWQ